jgi:hypothetical protein
LKYTLKNGRSVIVSDKDVEKLMATLSISKEDAIDLWLDDNGYQVNEIAKELDEKASKVHIDREIVQKTSKKERKKPEIKVSDEKKELFNAILWHLQEIYDQPNENVEILNENKLISVKIGDKTFKIDVIQTRQPKKA